MDYDWSPSGLLEARRAWLEGHRENIARRARHSTTWTTTGIGEVEISTAFRFDVTFIEEPSFTSGFMVDEDTDLVDHYFPRAGCGIHKWVKDNFGFYTGAYLFFTVDVISSGQTLGVQPNYIIHHHLAWEGMAIKDVPAHLLDF